MEFTSKELETIYLALCTLLERKNNIAVLVKNDPEYFAEVRADIELINELMTKVKDEYVKTPTESIGNKNG